MFIKGITIENFKCFEFLEKEEFGTPSGERGSGLNVFIGDNANGKTTFLEAINYLTLNSYSAENKLDVNDFADFKNEIKIKANTDNYICKMELPWKGFFSSNGIIFEAKNRERKEKNKILSKSFELKSKFRNIEKNYRKENGDDSKKEIPDLFLKFNPQQIKDDNLNIFYFDKNRSRQINNGTFKTTFERICDDLNWKFVKSLKNKDDSEKEKIIDSICGDFFECVLSTSQKGSGNKTVEELKDFFNQSAYKNLKIELLDLLHPFKNSFFAMRDSNSLKQIKSNNLGSGIEMILTLLLLKNISNESPGSIVYLIDEPEMHLHPKAQKKFLDLLLEESKDKQIFISTHSPYMFQGAIGEGSSLWIFQKDVNNDIEIQNAKKRGWGLFGSYSPTWGEINWFAYDLATVEFHNELYGLIESNHPTILKSLTKDKGWFNEKRQKWEKVSLQTYIRHSIHHPENKNNKKYTENDLRFSIEEMINLLN